MNSDLLGREQSSFAYADYGIPDQQNGYIGTRNAYLSETPNVAARFVQVTQAGYAWAAENPDAAAEILIEAGDFSNPELVRGSMQAIAEGGFLDAGSRPVGGIDAERFTAMARFLFDSGVLTGPDGTALHWPGDVSDWHEQEWMIGDS